MRCRRGGLCQSWPCSSTTGSPSPKILRPLSSATNRAQPNPGDTGPLQAAAQLPANMTQWSSPPTARLGPHNVSPRAGWTRPPVDPVAPIVGLKAARQRPQNHHPNMRSLPCPPSGPDVASGHRRGVRRQTRQRPGVGLRTPPRRYNPAAGAAGRRGCSHPTDSGGLAVDPVARRLRAMLGPPPDLRQIRRAASLVQAAGAAAPASGVTQTLSLHQTPQVLERPGRRGAAGMSKVRRSPHRS
jgi:hypothetical protein